MLAAMKRSALITAALMLLPLGLGFVLGRMSVSQDQAPDLQTQASERVTYLPSDDSTALAIREAAAAAEARWEVDRSNERDGIKDGRLVLPQTRYPK